MSVNLHYVNPVFGLQRFCITPIKDKQTNGAIDKSILQICPECKNNSMSLIPLEKEEAYQISIGAKRGLEIQFSLLKHQKR
jgi:hypothetical protein